MERLRKEKELKIKTKNEPTDPGKLLSLFIDI
jgi:hypothetical protein